MGKWRAALDSAHRIGVSTFFRGVLTVDEGACGRRFKNVRIGNVFASASKGSGRTGKWRAALDSAHRIGVSTLSRGVLNVDEGVWRSRVKNGRIGNVLAAASSSSGRTGKWRAALDSAHRIGVSILSRRVFDVDEGACGRRFKNVRIGNVFASASKGSGRTGKWRAALDSAHRIGVSTFSKGVLIVDE